MTMEIPPFPTNDFHSVVLVEWFPDVSEIKQIVLQNADFNTTETMYVNVGVPKHRDGYSRFRFRLTLSLEELPDEAD